MKKLFVLVVFSWTLLLLIPLISCKSDNGMNDWSGPNWDQHCGGPMLEFTYVPPIGSYNNLEGVAGQTDHNTHAVVVYIHVSSGWWIKPYAHDSLTDIDPGCNWECDITTGGIDSSADQIAVFLIPNYLKPPGANGRTELPEIPEALTMVITKR